METLRLESKEEHDTGTTFPVKNAEFFAPLAGNPAKPAYIKYPAATNSQRMYRCPEASSTII